MPALLDKPQPKAPQGEYSVIPPGQEHRYRESGMVTSDFLQMEIDEKNMYIAPLIITNAAEDRDGEVTDPNGIFDQEYKRTPLVFFNHSHKFDPGMFPVGTAETPSRQYDCKRQGDIWVSGCRFTKAAKIGEQTFALVVDGVIRGRSIGGLTHDMVMYAPQAPGKAFHKGQIVPVKTRSVRRTLLELVEWSWTPIPSNRDVVTAVKSILSKNRYNGQSLDNGLKFALKSLDLSEPATSTKNMRRLPHEKQATWTSFSVRGNVMSDLAPVAIRFDTKHFTPATAKAFLQQHSETLIDSELMLDEAGGDVFMRANQVAYTGKTDIATDPRLPGVQLLIAKSGFFGKADDEKPAEKPMPQANATNANPEGDIVQRIIEDAQKDMVAVDEGGAQQPAGGAPAPAQAAPAQAAAPAQGAEQQAVIDAEKAMKGPRGSQWLKAYMQKVAEILDMAEASQEELEPEMVEKCGEFNQMARALIGKMGEYHKTRYEAPMPGDPNAVVEGELDPDAELPETGGEDEGEEVEKEEKPNAHMSKAAKIAVFYGRQISVPKIVLSAIQSAEEKLSGNEQASEARQLLASVTKGYVTERQKVTDSENETLRKIKEELARRQNAERLRRLTIS